MDKSFFRFKEWNFALFQFSHTLDSSADIVRMSDIGESHRGKFFRRVTYHTAKNRIDLSVPEIRLQYSHADLTFFEDFSESFLVLAQFLLYQFVFGNTSGDAESTYDFPVVIIKRKFSR